MSAPNIMIKEPLLGIMEEGYGISFTPDVMVIHAHCTVPGIML
jgi:hypothetical protein